jgi:Xaa-Pro dipeptidase
MSPRITPDEHQRRLDALQRVVARQAVDVFIVSSFESIFYLTGAGFEPLERPFFLLIRPNGPPTLLVPKLDHEHMKKAHGIQHENLVTYWEYPTSGRRGWPDRLRDLLDEDQLLGVEPSLRREISDELQEYTLRTTPLIEDARRVKSRAEIDMIRRAAYYADVGVDRLLAASYYGATVAEGFAETRHVTSKIIREVNDWDPVTTKVLMATWAAPHSAMPHSIPALDHRLEVGPHVGLVLTRVNGYAGECERTYFTAPPTSDARAAFAAMMEARRIAFDMIRPGLPCGELDLKLNEFLTNEGYAGEDVRLHRAGHGLGLGNHEAPWIAEGSKEHLAENMVISVEPGIYLQGVGGVRHSDTVLVTEHGAECLTHVSADLDSLVLRSSNLLARIKGKLVRHALGCHLRNPVRSAETVHL